MIDKYCFEYLELMLPELHLNVRNPTKLIPAKLSPKSFYVISRISMSKAKTLLREFFFNKKCFFIHKEHIGIPRI